MKYKLPKIIAEIGCSHGGSLERAKMLSKLAKDHGADYLKTQKRNPEESTPDHIKHKPHPNPFFSYGETYIDHRNNLELNISEHAELKRYCDLIGIEYCCSVWDMTSTKEIISLSPSLIKIPSACNNNDVMLKYIIDNFSGDIHISFGMTSKTEKDSIINNLKKHANRFVLYHCTSIYPCPFEKLNLLEIENMQKYREYGFRVGFSNHGYGISSDIAALVLGSEWFERHFIDDRAYRHNDAAASLEPDGLRRLSRDLKNIHSALTVLPESIYEEEKIEKNKLRK